MELRLAEVHRRAREVHRLSPTVRDTALAMLYRDTLRHLLEHETLDPRAGALIEAALAAELAWPHRSG